MFDTFMKWLACGCMLLAACTAPNPKSCADGSCTDPALPFCDLNGEIAGAPNTCVAVSCSPNEFAACRGDQAIVCNAGGDNYDLVQCELGCDASVGGCRSSCTVDPDCSPDQPVCRDGACAACMGDTECQSRPETPFCDQGACVQCVNASQCEPITPVCDQNACRACLVDSECDSGACGTDGTCVPETEIIYLSNVNPVDNTCTKTSPCASFQFGQTKLSGTRNHFVLVGGGTFAANLILAGAVTPPTSVFVHGHGASLIPIGGTPTNIISSSKNLTLRELTISGMTSNNSIVVSGPTTLESVTISGAKKFRVEAPVVARDLRISNSSDAEAILLDTANADLTIDRGTISGGAVGLNVTAVGAKVHLKNLLITGTSGRALELAQGVGELEFSTIADAGAQSSGAPCAVACNANLHVTSSIIVQETCANAVRDAAGPCTFASSIVSNGPAPGITNVDPQFVNRAGGDYHITATSPAKDAVASGPATDFEGDPRPRGLKFDIGADEAP